MKSSKLTVPSVIAINDSILSFAKSRRRHWVIADRKKFLVSFSLLKDRFVKATVAGTVRNMRRQIG